MESLENKSEVGGAVAESQVLSTISERKPQCVLLQTCDVKIRNDTKVTRARLLLDNGSMRSFVDKDIACKLKLPVIRRESLSVFTFGNKSPIKKTFDVVKIELENREKPDFSVKIEALVTEQISGSDLPPSNLKAEIVQKYLEGFQLADSCSKGKVAVLVGADYYHNIVLGGIRRLKGQLVATETIFGWCLIGRDSDVRDVSVSLNIIIEEDLISGLIKKFWELESLGIAENEFSDPSNDSVVQRFESEIEYQNSRYRVRLPWKSDKKYILSDNKKVAERRFERLRRRFVRNPELYKSYQAVLHDYLQQKIIELVPNTCDAERITFYLPHREVVRNDRSSSKFRVVFDASSHDVGEVSLNDCLHIGPNLYPDIFDLLLRFRLHPIAFTADIKQAFLQIEVNEKDRDVSRFLFTDDPTDVSKSPQIYRFTRVLFGVNSSPFMLAATIKHHLRKYQGIYPETSEFLNNSIYVDDIIGGHQNTEDAYHTSTECMHIFREAGMTLHKWQTNSEELRKLWIKEDMVSGDSSQVVEPSGLPFKVLGVSWNKREDSLYFDVQNLVTFLSSRVNSKRCLLQAIGRIFDPVGFLGPFVLRVKLLMQEIWKLPLDWDDDLPECLSLAWNRWCNEVPGLGELRIPRYLFSNMFNVGITKIELHCFSDASQKAYATVAYLRILFNDERIRTVFVASKTRVAPLKKLTLPRLELMGALLSARLSYRIIKALNLNLVCRFWTDSQITLFWIKGTANKFKSFIKNRVEEIVKLTSPEDWYFCPGKSNPSDLASRGTSVFELRDNPVWFQGPEWLELTSEYWPMQNNAILEGLDGIELEYRKTVSNVIQFGCTVNSEKLLVLENYSSLRRLYRVTAWIKRFIKRVKKIVTTKGPLTTEELEEAEMHWIQVEQRQCYSEEFETLAGVGQAKKNSSLYNFGPFLDDKGILRMGGRLEYSDFSSDEKHPIILPRNSSLTGLIVQDEHICMKHGGIATTLAKIRELEQISKILLHDNFHDFFCNQKITWKFIVERGAWWGGFYERLVKSVKECLRKVLGRALLSFEELSTILTEVEAVLNSRPLTYVYNDLREPLPLQPVQFLNFARSDSTLPINFKEIIAAGSSRPSLIKRKNYQDLLVKQLWSKWKKQYIMDLLNAHALKNPNPQQNIKIDDVVLIEGDNKSKLLWKLGRVIQVFPGRDGGVRSCLLKTSDGTLKRPVQLLYPLEL
ncbi:hypothetical protein AVEN_62991-1 [Araneus ventricosus]|uniref:Peptidase aspartic putative domain-containing protein n=1 Tax=Araneus ventricosus TaxID=182803 RepID=A0A4Y2CSF3_ARAVE|nr:hypothetical protein AVEN_62991-1 [Araneus ventricosus]